MKTSPHTPRRSQRRRRALAVGALAAVLVACTSDPGPRRVAQDIVEAEREEGRLTESEAECMLGKLEAYSNDFLVEIDEGLSKGEGSAERNEAEAAITAYENDLASCRQD